MTTTGNITNGVHDGALNAQWIGGACFQAGIYRDGSIARSGQGHSDGGE